MAETTQQRDTIVRPQDAVRMIEELNAAGVIGRMNFMLLGPSLRLIKAVALNDDTLEGIKEILDYVQDSEDAAVILVHRREAFTDQAMRLYAQKARSELRMADARLLDQFVVDANGSVTRVLDLPIH